METLKALVMQEDKQEEVLDLMKRLLRAFTVVSVGLAFATVTFAQGMPGSVPGPPDVSPAPIIPPPPAEQMTKDTGKKQAPKSAKKHKRKKHKRSPKPVQP